MLSLSYSAGLPYSCCVKKHGSKVIVHKTSNQVIIIIMAWLCERRSMKGEGGGGGALRPAGTLVADEAKAGQAFTAAAAAGLVWVGC